MKELFFILCVVVSLLSSELSLGEANANSGSGEMFDSHKADGGISGRAHLNVSNVRRVPVLEQMFHASQDNSRPQYEFLNSLRFEREEYNVKVAPVVPPVAVPDRPQGWRFKHRP